MWIRRVSYLPDPGWRDPGTKRRDGREEGAAEGTPHLLKRLVRNPEASEDELKVLNRLSRVSVHSNPHWQMEQGKQSRTDKNLARDGV